MRYSLDYSTRSHTPLGRYQFPRIAQSDLERCAFAKIQDQLLDIMKKMDSFWDVNVSNSQWPCSGIMFTHDNCPMNYFIEYKCYLSLIKPSIKSPKICLITSTIETVVLSLLNYGINGAEVIITPSKKNEVLRISYRIFCDYEVDHQLISNIFPTACTNYRIGRLKNGREEFESVKKKQSNGFDQSVSFKRF